jgi:hypothetical protein
MMREANEITAIVVSSIKTTRRSIKPPGVISSQSSKRPAIRNPQSEIGYATPNFNIQEDL